MRTEVSSPYRVSTSDSVCGIHPFTRCETLSLTAVSSGLLSRCGTVGYAVGEGRGPPYDLLIERSRIECLPCTWLSALLSMPFEIFMWVSRFDPPPGTRCEADASGAELGRGVHPEPTDQEAKMSQRQLELGDDSGAIKLAGLPFIGNHLLFFQAIQVGFENPQVTVSQNPTVSLFRRYERCCCPAEDH